ncbi:MAG: DeoR/GlpR transcriptional regulator [Bacteroidales bacterium]|nr:DeoR/GlpR transcriptional regulator [Bacteroidales bacterium]
MDIYDSAQGRRSAILQKLKEDSTVNVTHLSEMFGVSEVTIRKDLRILQERKLLLRVHGGAIMVTNTTESDPEERNFRSKQMVNIKEKRAIGRAAAAHIRNGDTIMVDSGTTALEIVKNLDGFTDLTIITNSVHAVLEAVKYKRFKVVLLGGTVRETSLSTVGALTESNLKLFYCDKLFLGVDSISVEAGLSTPSIDEASTNQVMISRAREVYAVFDSTKFNKRALAFIAMPDKLSTVITDQNLAPEIRSRLESLKIKVETVSVQ